MARRIAVELVVTGSQQARQVLNNFSNDIQVLAQQAQAIQKATVGFQNSLFPNQGPAGSGQGQQLGATRQQLLAVGNTIKTITDLTLTLGKGQEILGLKTVDYSGDLNQLLAATKNYGDELTKVISQHADAGVAVNKLGDAYGNLISKQQTYTTSAKQSIEAANARKVTASGKVAAAQGVLTLAQENTASAQANFDSLRRNSAGRSINSTGQFTGEETAARETLDQALKNEARARQHYTAVNNAANNEINNADKQLANATRQLAETTTLQQKLVARQGREGDRILTASNNRINNVIANGERAISAARNGPSPLPGSIATIQSESPELLRKLQQAGLGQGAKGTKTPAIGSPDYISNLQSQGAYDSIKVNRDLVRQITRVSGAFKDQKGVMQSFNAEYDKSGTVVTRFGGQISGIGNILSQLGRNFQKVIEFAIATTVVFKSLQFAISELNTIKDLDKNIRQLSITANLTRPDAVGLFQDISDIAIATATPLVELTKATDDIALATKRAGQSASEWREDILSLTQSVGILTNLAGIDTVEATDQLVSTMKQLNLQADDLPGILNKVTAVAGGQSNAIADIIKGLGVMAEAGQQAGLSIDQMIATIQTLSQVTSKSPSEVATALKNLVGSIDGPAGSKALKAYNIELKDSAGNLRNIIDIYSEISDKIKKGVIPESDVKALVRAIAGGPRRAPDAAALLSAVGDINDVATKSINATNEALIANAKILDTASAKFIQLQAAIDKFAASKFSNVLSETAGSLAEILTHVLEIFEAIPTSVYVALVQFAAFAAAGKAFLSVGGFVVATLKGWKEGLIGVAGLLGIVAREQQALNTQSRTSPILGANGQPIQVPGTPISRKDRLGNVFGSPGKYVGPLAAGGLAAATGIATGDIAGGIGAGLQTAGLVSLLAPDPTLISKPLGAALIAAGFAVQFFGDQVDVLKNKTKESDQEIAIQTESILNAVNAYKESSGEVVKLTATQDDLGKSIESLQATQKITKEQTTTLTALQGDYTENAIKLLQANDALTESFEKLNKSLGDAHFDSFVLAAARAGAYTKEQIKELTTELAPKILEATNPNFVAPANFILPKPNLGSFAATTGSSVAQLPQYQNKYSTGVRGEIPKSVRIEDKAFDLQQLATDAKAVRDLFTESGDALKGTFAPTYENLQLIDNALKAIQKDVDPATYERLQQTFQGYASQVNALFAAERNVALYKAYLQSGGATGLFTPEEVKNGNAILDIYQQLVQLIPKAVLNRAGTQGPDDRNSAGYEDQLKNLATKFAFNDKGEVNLSANYDDAVKVGEAILEGNNQLDDLRAKGDVLKGIALLFKSVGIEVDGLTNSVEILGNQADESFAKFVEGLEGVRDKATTDLTSKLADLQARLQGGEFGGKGEPTMGDYSAEKDQLESLLTTINEVSNAYLRAADTIPGFKDGLDSFKDSLISVNGLQDAQILTSDQLVDRLFALADTYGLTGNQVDILGKKLESLIGIIDAISKIKAQFGIKANVDISEAIATLKVLANLSVDERPGHAGGADPAILAAIAQLQALQKQFGSVGTSINNLYKSGQGTAQGTSAKAKKAAAKKAVQGPDVSELDLPDEIANSANRSALIQEAIKRAKALQSKIPGATKEAKNDIVELLKGTQRILEVRGVKDDLLRKALNELAEIEKKKLEFETKADTIRRIRVGAGDFSAIANVPVNSRTGVSLGSPSGPVNVTLNLNGTILTPAQLSQFADLIAASLKRQIAG